MNYFLITDVLQRLQENNLCLAADKTTICPKSLNILGWVWKDGTLQSDPHKINPLKTCQQPQTVKQLRPVALNISKAGWEVFTRICN